MANKKNISQNKDNLLNKKEPLSLFITIVNRGISSPILSLFNTLGSSLQFVQVGQGTARREVLDILGIEDSSKDVIFSVVRQKDVSNIQEELEAFFISGRRNKGVAFAIPFSSVIGLKAYHFLVNDL